MFVIVLCVIAVIITILLQLFVFVFVLSNVALCIFVNIIFIILHTVNALQSVSIRRQWVRECENWLLVTGDLQTVLKQALSTSLH